MLKVIKVGGATMRSLETVRATAATVARTISEHERVVLVVSALAGETDRLLALGGAGANSAELDALAATGEQASAALFAIALQAEGRAAQSFLAHQIPILTDSVHGDAEITSVSREALDRCLSSGAIPVVAGFQGIGPDGRTTTLGRGGSDTTAVAIAAALGADECVFLKDVDGIRSADPKLCAGSRRIDTIAYRHLLAMTENGAKILHAKSVRLAMRHGLRLRITDSLEGMGGTLVIADEPKTQPRVIAIAARDTQISLIGDFPRLARARMAAFVRSCLSTAGIPAWPIGPNLEDEEGLALRFEVGPRAPAAVRCLHVELCGASAVPQIPEISVLNLHWSEA